MTAFHQTITLVHENENSRLKGLTSRNYAAQSHRKTYSHLESSHRHISIRLEPAPDACTIAY